MVLLLLSYLLGSIPFGVILAELFGGADVRKAGSGNIGATNVARVAGPAAGVLTLLLDAGKGWFAVWLAGHFMHGASGLLVAAGFFTLLGHCFPPWLRFRGGKGVATAAVLSVVPGGAVGGANAVRTGGLVLALRPLGCRAAAAIPLLVIFMGAAFCAANIVTVGSLAIAALVIFQHRGNICRLMRGE
jgi:glycerol-3-phosphate acyltransferase PlsY